MHGNAKRPTRSRSLPKAYDPNPTGTQVDIRYALAYATTFPENPDGQPNYRK